MRNGLKPITRYATQRRQRGVVGLTLAIIAMLSVSAFVVPMLIRANNASRLDQAGALRTEAGRSAIEHAVWRLQEDSGFFGTLAGSPPSTLYQLNEGSLSADVTVATSSYSSPANDIELVVTTNTPTIPINTETQVDFTIRVFNNTTAAQQISYIEISPQGSVTTSFVSGSSSGFDTDNPSSISGGWRWNFWPYIEIGPFGASDTHSFSLDMQGGQNVYWLDVEVGVSGSGSVQVPFEPGVKATGISGLSMTSATVPSVAEAGVTTTFDTQIVLHNQGSNRDVTRIRHMIPSSLSYVSGSSFGVTSNNPTISSGTGPRGDMTTLTWNFGGFELATGVPQELSFKVAGSPAPGEYPSKSTFRVSGDGAPSAEYSASTGIQTAITTSRKFDLSIDHDDLQTNAEVWIYSDTPVVTWIDEQ